MAAEAGATAAAPAAERPGPGGKVLATAESAEPGLDDDLQRDLTTLRVLFPTVDGEQVLLPLLLARRDDPNRMQNVTAELLHNEREEDGEDEFMPAPDDVIGERDDVMLPQGDALSPQLDGVAAAIGNGKLAPAIVAAAGGDDDAIYVDCDSSDSDGQMEDWQAVWRQQDLANLMLLFPDADPDYLLEQLEEAANDDPQPVQGIVNALLEDRDYPKLKDLQEKERQMLRRRQVLDMTFDLDCFLESCDVDDPSAEFMDEQKPTGELYRQHTSIQLQNYFLLLSKRLIVATVEKHGWHFLPALRELEKLNASGTRRTRLNPEGLLLSRPRQRMELPEEPDEVFFREFLYSQHEEEICGALRQQQWERQVKLDDARQAGALRECLCCCEDEFLAEEMTSCADGHQFCKECIRSQGDEIVGSQQTSFPCLAQCPCTLRPNELQRALKPKVLKKFLENVQLEELRTAEIHDLVSCPFCNFAAIMPNAEDKVFRCMNPDCLKESCRLCMEPNHIPLRCEEVTKGTELAMRKHIESKMTEAMLRTCWRCKKQFFKEEGCNMMTCSCGAKICYICRQRVRNYRHFGDGRCPLFSDVAQLHQDEIDAGGDAAEEEFKQTNPGAAGVTLKDDPRRGVKRKHASLFQRSAQFVLNNAANWLRNFRPNLNRPGPEPQDPHQEEDEDAVAPPAQRRNGHNPVANQPQQAGDIRIPWLQIPLINLDHWQRHADMPRLPQPGEDPAAAAIPPAAGRYTLGSLLRPLLQRIATVLPIGGGGGGGAAAATEDADADAAAAVVDGDDDRPEDIAEN